MLTRLAKQAGHDVAISAFWGLGGKSLDWDGMRVYPADENWGNTYLPAYAMHMGDGDLAEVLGQTRAHLHDGSPVADSVLGRAG